jgi:mannose-6-phosphate isomerase-like protein (cupin superfamily)
MNHIKADESVRYENSQNCVAFEYEFDGEKDINSAVIELSGRYPDSGFSMNTICKEIIYVIEGSGQVGISDNTTQLKRGDMVRIKPNEHYYFVGKMKLLISSSPAWYPEQYRTVV